MSIVSFCNSCCGSIDAADDYVCTCGDCHQGCHGSSFLHKSCLGPSQLVTQWGVFLTRIGTEWEYNAQEYVCDHRLTFEQGTFSFKPDFWLPEERLFGKTVSTLNRPGLVKLLNAAAYLSAAGWPGTPHKGFGTLIFGNIPASGWRLPTQLHMHKGTLEASGWYPGSQKINGKIIARDYGGSLDEICNDADVSPYPVRNQGVPERIAQWLTRGSWETEWVDLTDVIEVDKEFTFAAERARDVITIPGEFAEGSVPGPLPGSASPIEKKFWDAHCRLALPELRGLTFQHPVLRYRLDFALPALKLGIELDGFRNHSNPADLARDHQRRRKIEAEGWQLTRFGGSEVHHYADRCIQDAARWVRQMRSQ